MGDGGPVARPMHSSGGGARMDSPRVRRQEEAAHMHSQLGSSTSPDRGEPRLYQVGAQGSVPWPDSCTDGMQA